MENTPLQGLGGLLYAIAFSSWSGRLKTTLSCPIAFLDPLPRPRMGAMLGIPAIGLAALLANPDLRPFAVKNLRNQILVRVCYPPCVSRVHTHTHTHAHTHTHTHVCSRFLCSRTSPLPAPDE
jgi:hypothetical protein